MESGEFGPLFTPPTKDYYLLILFIIDSRFCVLIFWSIVVQETGKIWMNGQMVEWKDAQVHVLSHTLHYGLGFFEGIRCYQAEGGAAIFRLKDHVQRLFLSAHIVQVKIPYTQETITEAIIETIRHNNLTECYIRPIVYIGYGSMGLFPEDNPIQVAIAVWPWGSYLGEEGLRKGIRSKISSIARHHVNSSFSRAKITGYYANSQLAKKEAREEGYDEAILLDTEGYIAEGSGENLFMVRGGELKTPPVTSVLEGITRDTVIQIANESGYAVREMKFTRDELYIADEAFLTGTAAEVTPVREVDGRQIAGGSAGPITQSIQSKYFKVVKGEDPSHRDWLTYL